MNAIIASPYLDLSHVPVRDPKPDMVLLAVQHGYQLDEDELKYGGKHRRLAEARKVTYYLLRTLTDLSFPEIGRVMNRDHTTVMSGYRSIIAERAKSEDFAQYIDRLSESVGRLLDASASV